MNAFDGTGNGGEPPEKRPRRRRYSGTHPKKFQQKYKEHNISAYPEIREHLLAKGKTPASSHIPVLTEEVIACLQPKSGEIIVDCTVGYGGPASQLFKRKRARGQK